MRKIFLFIVLLVCMSGDSIGQPYKIPAGAKRILFLGNSITYAGQYVTYIEAYIKLKSKSDGIEFMNLGLPSETVSGLSEPNHADGKFPRPDLHERLQRVLTKTKPDLVFACYGMNDGIYLPFDSIRFKKYQDGIHWLHDSITAMGIPIILFTPPVYDERKGQEYSLVLDKYAGWLLNTRNTDNWQVIDIHFPMKEFLENRRSIDSTFQFAQDGVHPNATGHWIMARAVLAGLGFTEAVTASDAQAAFNKFNMQTAVIELIEKRQAIMKDAWLNYTRHTRPMMPQGVPVKKAKVEYRKIHRRLKLLLESN